MTVQLYAFNVGWGDSFLIEWEEEGQNRYILIDGGNWHIAPYPPISYLRESKIIQIDLLVLTHLHSDHLYGFIDVVKEIKILEAVLPYPYHTLFLERITQPEALEVIEVWEIYVETWELLQKQWTKINLPPAFKGIDAWSSGKITLKHLDPLPGDPLPAYNGIIPITRENNLTPLEQEKLLIYFNRESNYDSNIWLLQDSTGIPLLLLGADAPVDNWKRLLQRKKVEAPIVKVSHHGMIDGMNEEILRR